MLFHRKRTTNRAQLEKIVELMKPHPDLAKNLTKSSVEFIQELWQNLRDQLNSLGPQLKKQQSGKRLDALIRLNRNIKVFIFLKFRFGVTINPR